MKKRISLLLVFLLLTSQLAFATPKSISSMNRTLKVNGVNKSFQQVTVNLNDKEIIVNTAVGNDKIGKPENFNSLVKRKSALAAINANYFDAYKTMEPIGAIMSNGKFLHLEGDAPSLVATRDGNVSIGQHRIRVELTTNNQSFELHQINLKPTSKSQLIITPERANSINLPAGTSVSVVNNRITKVSKDLKNSPIPKNGYLIFFGSETYRGKNASNIFKVGNEISLRNSIARSTSPQTSSANPQITKLFGITNAVDESKDLIEKGRKFNIWMINNDPADPTGVYLLSREKGDNIKTNGGHAVSIKNGLVYKVDLNVRTINTSGMDYVIYLGSKAADEEYVKHRFELGRRVSFYNEENNEINTDEILNKAIGLNKSAISSSNIDLSNPLALVSAGPNLILNNKIVFDPNTTSFKEAKIRSNRAVRSAVGITKDNRLLMITASNLTMLELAQLMKQAGAVDAINLDGGASSGLYHNGKTLRKPGRNLHTILTIKNLPSKKVKK